jgi:hypothetical protein
LTTRWMLAALCAFVTVAASCSGDDTPADGPERTHDLGGRILATGFSGGENVQIYDLETGRTTELPMPRGVEVLNAFWGPDGDTAYALATPVTSLGTPTAVGRVQLYEATPGGETRPVGRALDDTNGEALSVSGSRVLASECNARDQRLLLLELDGARRWKEVAPGCAGALSPDGSTILFARGLRLWEASVDGGDAEAVADLRRVKEDDELLRVESIAGVSYATSAIVAFVEVDGRLWPAIGTSGEPFRLIRLEDYPATLGVAPQPDGDLIALTQAFGNARTSSLIRMYDSSSRDLEVVGAGNGGYFEPAWAPSGDVMVASNLASSWVFLDESGEWLDVRTVTGLVARDWVD